MKTAITILNWNGKGFLKKYIPLLIAESNIGENAVIVADNGSCDGSMEWLAEHYRTAPIETYPGEMENGKGRCTAEIYTIRFDTNYGFSKGYNMALSKIKAQYYVLLNSDVRVSENWINILNGFMDSHKEFSICMPKILSETRHEERLGGSTDTEMFEYAGASGGFIDKRGFPFCRGRILSYTEEDRGQYDNTREIFWASGACMMVRREVYEKLGGLDESFFAHMEEIDFCWRAKLLGFKVCVVPQSIVYHVGGGALPNNSPRKLYLNYRNNLLMLYKNLSCSERSKRKFISIRKIIDGLSAIVYLIQGHFSYTAAVVKAHRDFDKMKGSVTISPRILSSKGAGIPFPSYPRSIIKSFFSGKRTFSQIEDEIK